VGDPGVHESGKRGLATFLSDHEGCGAGFDIQRREASGGSIVRVVCGGCGEAIEYPAAGGVELPVEQPASRSVPERIRDRQRRPSASPATAAHRPKPRRAPRGRSSGTAGVDGLASNAPKHRSLGWPSPLSLAVIALLIGGGLLLVILGVGSNSGISDRKADGTTTSASSPAPTVAAPALAPPKPLPRIKLDRRTFVERVSIGIPVGWNAGVSGGAVSVAALNGRSEVQVYFEQGARPDRELAERSRTFLLQRHPGAHVAAEGRTEVGGRRARSVTVAFPGGTESALVLVAGGYTYLVLKQLGRPSAPALRRATDAVVASFRPV
jgi:hypothetical protein